MTQPPAGAPLVALRDVSRVFPGVVALDHVSTELHAGRVHGLMGENGAGKSTIIKILSGLYPPSSGHLERGGRVVAFHDAAQAQAQGIRTIHQELSLVPMLSIAENIFAGTLPTTRAGLVNRTRLREDTARILAQLELPHDPDTLVGTLSLAQQQLVEIGRALAHRADVLILDEPTSSLTERETETLFRIVRELRASGTAILYVSHKLSEIFALCDEVTILRDGRHVGHGPIGDFDEDELVRRMAGRDVHNAYPPRGMPSPEVTVRAEGLANAVVGPCSFEVRRGEIVGLYGLVGSGRTELARMIFGAEPPTSGRLELDGQTLRLRSTQDAVAARIGYVTEDRKTLGVFLDFTVAQNTAAAAPQLVRRGSWHHPAAERDLAQTYISQLRVKTSGPEQIVSTLSGGNQQKVLLGKWLAINPRLLIVDEPTRGIDVSAKAEIHRLLRRFADGGMAVIAISSELPEVMGLSDRVLVMHGGVITAEVDPAIASPEDLLRAASGLTVAAPPPTPDVSGRHP